MNKFSSNEIKRIINKRLARRIIILESHLLITLVFNNKLFHPPICNPQPPNRQQFSSNLSQSSPSSLSSSCSKSPSTEVLLYNKAARRQIGKTRNYQADLTRFPHHFQPKVTHNEAAYDIGALGIK